VASTRNVVKRAQLAAVGTTGNNTSSAIELPTGDGMAQVGLLVRIEAAGATPTVTYKLQGSFDNVVWGDVALISSDSDTVINTATKTAVADFLYHVAQAHSRAFRYYRFVTAANTNVTYSAQLFGWQT
jgi:hypothetical protein